MTRSVWKGPFFHPSLLKKIDKLKDATNKKPIKTWSRRSTILPQFVGLTFGVYNGQKFVPVTVYLLTNQNSRNANNNIQVTVGKPKISPPKKYLKSLSFIASGRPSVTKSE